MAHRSVLLAETIEALAPTPDGVYIDATFGAGGHARAILQRLGADGRLLAMDCDPQAVAAGRRGFADEPRLALERRRFSEIAELAEAHGVRGRVRGALFDLGLSSEQFESAERGFGFMRDGPLDMRMNAEEGVSAGDWLASADEAEIGRVLRDYGELRPWRRLAAAIVAARRDGALNGTTALAQLALAHLGGGRRRHHPATRLFQAIRIHINDELGELQRALAQTPALLGAAGRLVVISFHSLEDRIVKRFMRSGGVAEGEPALRALGRARRPGVAELRANRRARSARLRVAERLSEAAA